jgi:DNA-binding ferritin-like protein
MADRLVALLMHSRNQAHTYHLLTNSYAQHKALGKYYEKITDLLDDYAEAYMGKYGRFRKFNVNSRLNKDPRKSPVYFKSLVAKIRRIRLPRDPYLKNILEEIIAHIRKTQYMLTLR